MSIPVPISRIFSAEDASLLKSLEKKETGDREKEFHGTQHTNFAIYEKLTRSNHGKEPLEATSAEHGKGNNYANMIDIDRQFRIVQAWSRWVLLTLYRTN